MSQGVNVVEAPRAIVVEIDAQWRLERRPQPTKWLAQYGVCRNQRRINMKLLTLAAVLALGSISMPASASEHVFKLYI